MRKVAISLFVLVLWLSLAQVKSARAYGPDDVIRFVRGIVLGESTTGDENKTKNERSQFGLSQNGAGNKDNRGVRAEARFRSASTGGTLKFNDDRAGNGSKSGKIENAGTGGTQSGNLKERVCENRKEFGAHRLAVVSERVNKLLDHMDGFLTRVEAFYTNKLVPQGIVVANYDSLLADISAKNSALESAISSVQTGSENISCEKGEVKTDLKNFKSTITALEKAMKDYRDSIKKFVQAIRTAAGNFKESSEASESAETSTESGNSD